MPVFPITERIGNRFGEVELVAVVCYDAVALKDLPVAQRHRAVCIHRLFGLTPH